MVHRANKCAWLLRNSKENCGKTCESTFCGRHNYLISKGKKVLLVAIAVSGFCLIAVFAFLVAEVHLNISLFAFIKKQNKILILFCLNFCQTN